MSETNTEEQEPVNNELLELVAEFNIYPVRYIHSSWLKEVQYAQLVGLLKEKERSHFYLSSYLLGCFGLDTEFDYEFRAIEKRIALASNDQLLRLVLYVGIVLNESVIRAVVRRDERTKLEKCLGEEAYFFAVKKAQFLSRHNQAGSPSILIDWQNTERFKSFLMASGLQILAVVYADMPQAFRKRLLLKFPRSWSKHLEHPASDGVASREQGLKLLIKSYKEVNRQWRHLLS